VTNSETNPAPAEAIAAAVAPPLVYPEPLTAYDMEAYHDFRRDATWFDAMIHWSSIEGPKAAEALNGLVTNDVSQLIVGRSQHAVALTAKGKVVCDMGIVRITDERFMLAMSRPCAPAWLDLARKYINPRLARVADESDRWATWTLYGTNAVRAVAELCHPSPTGSDVTDGVATRLAAWPEWSHDLWDLGAVRVRLIRAPVLGRLPGFAIVAEARDADAVRSCLEASPRRRASRAVWDIARVEAGRPAFGVDMDDNTIPQEANLDTLGAISFTKGCYTGQETVARIHFRGHVNRHLRGLSAEAPLPQHARVFDATGRDVGDVRSTVISPRHGPIALAMIRREVAPGAVVRVGEGLGAKVMELPFGE
jgi:folate-binding protein YgfZ